MNSLIEPNIHPILVHFAYALSITAVAAYLLSRFPPAGLWRACDHRNDHCRAASLLHGGP